MTLQPILAPLSLVCFVIVSVLRGESVLYDAAAA